MEKKTTRKSEGFSDEELAAMKERSQELREQRRISPASNKDSEIAVLAKIDEMNEPDRTTARCIHAIIKETAPMLVPRTWYGMPAYSKSGNVVCFFQSAQKFKSRYATLGFSDKARLDDGSMWPTSFALRELTEIEEARIRTLIKRAVSDK